jgi:serine/threonine protein kinase
VHVHVTDDPRVGTELAGYRIESLLGIGGMSVVYLAEDLRLKRRVALKLLAPDLAQDGSFRERFLRESELAASIDHPNIVPIYEAATSGELLYIAMRYVEGRDLKERLRDGNLEPSDAIGILAQVASALDAAHVRGLVHRDVKPSNVLLDRGARPGRLRPRLPGGLRPHEAGLREERDRRRRPSPGHHRLRRSRADRRGRSRWARRRLLARLRALRVRGRTAAVPA